MQSCNSISHNLIVFPFQANPQITPPGTPIPIFPIAGEVEEANHRAVIGALNREEAVGQVLPRHLLSPPIPCWKQPAWPP